MGAVAVAYESFHGLRERPFSLTPDPKYFFKSRSHGGALEALTAGLRQREPFLLLTGDLGVGKTTTARTLIERLRPRSPVAYVENPLISPPDLLRLILRDFGAVADELAVERDTHELYDLLVAFVGGGSHDRERAVLIIDEAHLTPPLLLDHLSRLTALNVNGDKALQVVLAAQPVDGDRVPLAIAPLDAGMATRARLLPLGREDCAAYVAHRLTVAGGAEVVFTPRAIDVLFNLSGGLPRLVNLLCERALQEAAVSAARKIEPRSIEASASGLELLRARPKRFRWFQGARSREAH
jgi:type II secretory pathway predicted ATPase ExeA